MCSQTSARGGYYASNQWVNTLKSSNLYPIFHRNASYGAYASVMNKIHAFPLRRTLPFPALPPPPMPQLFVQNPPTKHNPHPHDSDEKIAPRSFQYLIIPVQDTGTYFSIWVSYAKRIQTNLISILHVNIHTRSTGSLRLPYHEVIPALEVIEALGERCSKI